MSEAGTTGSRERPPSDRAADGQRPHDGRRLRQHLRAAAAAADPETGFEPRGRRDADDAVPDRGVGGAGRVRTSRRPLAAASAGDGRPVVSVLCSACRRRAHRWLARGHLVVGGLGAAAFHPPAAALAHRLGGSRPGLAMSVHITGGTLGFSLGPLMFAPVGAAFRPPVDAGVRVAGSPRRAVLPLAGAADCAASARSRRLSRAAPIRAAARSPLRDRGVANARVAVVRDVRARNADSARRQRRPGGRGGRDLPARERHRRLLRRTRGGSFRPAPRHCVVADRVDTVSHRRRRCCRAGCSC